MACVDGAFSVIVFLEKVVSFVEYFIDLSAPTNGTGTAAAPFNTFTGLVYASDQRYWIRRTTTPYTDIINLGAVTNLELIGWPKLGDYAYLDRPSSNYAWDADTEDYWQLNNKAAATVLVASSSINCYISRLRLNISTTMSGADIRSITLGAHTVLSKYRQHQTAVCPAFCGLEIVKRSARIVDPIIYHSPAAAATLKGEPFFNPSPTSEGEGLCLLNARYELGNMLTGATTTLISRNTHIQNNELISAYVSGLNGTPFNRNVAFNSDYQITANNCTIALNVNQVTDGSVVFYTMSQSWSTATTASGTKGLMYATANKIYHNYRNIASFNSPGPEVALRTNVLAQIYATNGSTQIHPLSAGTIDTSASTWSTSANADIYISSMSNPSTNTSSNKANLIARDAGGGWFANGQIGDMNAVSMARNGVTSLAVVAEITNSIAAPSTGTSQPDIGPLKLGNSAVEAIKVSLVAGHYELQLYGADVSIPFTHPYCQRVLEVKYCDGTGPKLIVLNQPSSDTSVWTELSNYYPWVYSIELEVDDPVDLYFTMYIYDTYLISHQLVIDPTIVIVDLEI